MKLIKPLFIVNVLGYKILKSIKNDESIRYYKIDNICVKTRVKSIEKIIYKSYVKRKMPKDIFGIRIIYNNDYDHICYNMLSNLERNFDVIENSKKDYVTNPKENGYQSVHAHINFFNLPVEIQIRNKEMDWRCNYGSCNEYYLVKQIILHKIYSRLYLDLILIRYFIYLIFIT